MKKKHKDIIREDVSEIDDKRERLKIDKDDITVKKLESLIRLLEASEPFLPEGELAGLSEKHYFRSILDEKNKDRVILKIFELLKKY